MSSPPNPFIALTCTLPIIFLCIKNKSAKFLPTVSSVHLYHIPMDILVLKVCIYDTHTCGCTHSIYPLSIVVFTWYPIPTYHSFYIVLYPPIHSSLQNQLLPLTVLSSSLQKVFLISSSLSLHYT